jgi:hypothetical protein
MKKLWYRLHLLLFCLFFLNNAYSQYFEVKQETPRDFCVIGVSNGIKLEGKYYLNRIDWPEISKRAYYSGTTHRQYHYPTFSAIHTLTGDSLFSVSPVPLDTNHARQTWNMDTLGKDFIVFGADIHFYGPVGTTTEYDFRAAVIRMDKNGQAKWYKLVGDSLNNAVLRHEFVTGIVTWDKKIIAGGLSSDNSDSELFLVGLDSLGSVQWEKRYDRGFISSIWKLVQTKPNELYGFGHIDYYPTSSWSADVVKPWFVKLNTMGDILYEKAIELPEPGYVRSYIRDGVRAKNGDVVMGGVTLAPYPDLKAKSLLLRLDSMGNIKWYKIMEPYGNNDIGGMGIHSLGQHKDGRIWAVGINNHPWLLDCVPCFKKAGVLWLYNLDSAGNMLWQRSWFRSNLVIQEVQPYPGPRVLLEEDMGGLILAADSDTRCCPEYMNFVISEPHFLRVNCAGFTGLPKAEIYNQSIVSNVHTLHAKIWNTDSLIIEWGDGFKQRFSMIDTVFRDTVFTHTYPANGIYLHPNIKAYACGHVYESNGLGEAEDPYVHIHMQELPLKTLSIYPNPAENYVWVTGTHVQGSTQGRIINMQGQVVKTFELNKEALRLDIQDLPQGMYFVQVQGYSMQKLVRQ